MQLVWVASLAAMLPRRYSKISATVARPASAMEKPSVWAPPLAASDQPRAVRAPHLPAWGGWARAPSIYLPPERNMFETPAAETTTRQRRQVSIFVPCHSSRPPGVAGPRARSHSFKVLPRGAAAADADDHKFECESASFGSDLSVGGIVICCWGGLPPSLLLLLLPLLPSGPSSSSPYT